MLARVWWASSVKVAPAIVDCFHSPVAERGGIKEAARMPKFSYKARRRSGEIEEGVLELADRAAVLAQLDRRGLFPMAVETSGGAVVTAKKTASTVRVTFSAPSTPAAAAPTIQSFFNRKRKPSLQELATFTTQLANLLQAGMPLVEGLRSMSGLESKGIGPEVSGQLRQEVTEGKNLSAAMSAQPLIFPEMYVSMVRAGEQSGALVEVLRRLADHYTRFAEVRHKVTSAMVYPAFVIGVGVVMIIFFMTWMLPRFMGIFKGMKVTLPLSTRMLMAVGELATNWLIWAGAIAFVGTALWLFLRYRATPQGHREIDAYKLRMPVVGKIIGLSLFSQFARTLATLLQNGVPVLVALRITEEVLPNVVLKEAIARTRDGVTDGKSLAEPLERSKVFPKLMVDLVKIGEKTGDVPGSLRNVAETYENELTVALRVMTTLIEPVLIVVIALFVGFLLFGVLSAMFAITGSVAR